MFEDEKREQNMNENQDIESRDQEDIFAEPDVEIPADASYADNEAEQPQSKMESSSVQGMDGQSIYDASCAEGTQQEKTDSLYRYSYTRQDGAAQSDTPQEERVYDANTRESDGRQDRVRQPESQETSYRYSYIPQDKDPQEKGSQDRGGSGQKPAGKKKGTSVYAKAVGCAVLCGVIIGGCIIGSYAIGKNVVATSTAAVETTSAKLSTAESDDSASAEETSATSSGGEYTVAQIAEQCSSSVVAITNKSVSEVQTMFGTYEQESEGSGSGVIISQSDTELLIATNYHVIEDADELTVCFMDSEDWVYSTQLKGTDSDNDLAVIAVTLSDMDKEALNSISIATIGDSESLQVGDSVVAIGNALGLGQSVTSGIISALDREVTIDGVTYTLLQTDAAINAGNSGGALFNMNGELIGINTAKFSNSSSSSSTSIDNMGFAIPMSKAQSILEELMTQETKTKLSENYGCLNITGYDVSEEAVSMYGIPAGVYVYSVVEGAAADQAGLEAGDIITALDGSSVTDISELKEKLQYYVAGETVEVTIQRSNGSSYEEMTLTVILDNASEQDSSAIEDSVAQESQGSTESESDAAQGYGFGR